MTRHEIWRQVLLLTAAEKVKAADEGQTVVTPYVHSCFQHMFGDKLKVVEPINRDVVKQGTPMVMEGVVIPKPVRAERDKAGFIGRPKSRLSVKVGQVVAIRKESESEWESQSVTWFAYVQCIRELDRPWPKNVALDVIWIYAPEDTILAKERYPHHNEVRVAHSIPFDYKRSPVAPGHTPESLAQGANSCGVALFLGSLQLQ
jgi:DNA (cytosine-5)-methyltransferase 1